MAHGTILNVPFQLRGNDIQRHIINIDSRYRDNTITSSASDFLTTLLSPVKNILRVRITSFEFPNNYYMFTAKRQNISFQVAYLNSSGQTVTVPVTIPEGNYTACDMEKTLNEIFSASGSGLNWLSAAFDAVTGHFTFSSTQKFGVDMTYNSKCRTYDYGLGYYLGFSRAFHKSAKTTGTLWTVESDWQATFAGDSYIFLCLNDYVCVHHSVNGSNITAFAKFILREQKNYMTFDDYGGHHIKEIVFTNPQDIMRLHIRILDSYGDELDLGSNNFSFSLEVMEIKNVRLYETIRNSLNTSYIS